MKPCIICGKPSKKQSNVCSGECNIERNKRSMEVGKTEAHERSIKKRRNVVSEHWYGNQYVKVDRYAVDEFQAQEIDKES